MIVSINWIDIMHTEDDLTREEAIKLMPELMVTQGELLLDATDRVIVSSSKVGGDDWRCITVFPRSIVVRITELEAKNEVSME